MPLKIQISDETTSHSTRPPKNGSQVAGYKPGKARATNRSAAYVLICKQDFSHATLHGDETLDFEGYL
jgi:hypothetical protein